MGGLGEEEMMESVELGEHIGANEDTGDGRD